MTATGSTGTARPPLGLRPERASGPSSKILVVVYSKSGTGQALADMLCTARAWPRGTLADVHPRTGALGNLRCVLDSLLRRRAPFRYDGPRPREFDAVVLIAPIWANRLASPMRGFLHTYREQLPDVALVTVMGGGGSHAATAEIERLLGRPTMLSFPFMTREVASGSCRERLDTFARAVEASADDKRSARPARWKAQAA